MQHGHGLLKWEVEYLRIYNCIYIYMRRPFFERVWLGLMLEKVGCGMEVGGGAWTWSRTWLSWSRIPKGLESRPNLPCLQWSNKVIAWLKVTSDHIEVFGYSKFFARGIYLKRGKVATNLLADHSFCSWSWKCVLTLFVIHVKSTHRDFVSPLCIAKNKMNWMVKGHT